MNSSLKSVKEFHETFEHPVGNLTEAEELKIRQLRIKLLFEELQELAEASDCNRTFADLCAEAAFGIVEKFGGGTEIDSDEFMETVKETHDAHKIADGYNINKLEELDALCDIQYVLNGKILTSGLQNVFDAAFATVHSNNMNKAHVDGMHAIATITKLGHQPDEYVTKETSKGVLLYNKSGKLIKPHDHVKVSLGVYLE